MKNQYLKNFVTYRGEKIFLEEVREDIYLGLRWLKETKIFRFKQ